MLWIFDIFPHYKYQIPSCSDLWSWDAGIKLGSNQKHLLWSLVWEPEIQSSREYLEFILARVKSEAVDPFPEMSWLSHALVVVSRELHGICGGVLSSQGQLCVLYFFPGIGGCWSRFPLGDFSILNFSSLHFLALNPHSTGSVHRYVIVPGTEQS